MNYEVVELSLWTKFKLLFYKTQYETVGDEKIRYKVTPKTIYIQ